MRKYHYYAFGLNISSEFELPELLPSKGKTDVEIIHGIIDEVAPDLNEKKIIKFTKDDIIYQLKTEAGCRIIKGEKVIVQPHKSLSHSAIRLFILTSVMGCLLYQRKLFAIHGSSIVINGKCVIIAGYSGAGKSSLTSSFIQKGYKFLSDDISVICENNGEIYVQPGYPYRKLHSDSANALSINTGSLEIIDSEEEKYLVPAIDHYIQEPVPLYALIELAVGKDEYVTLEKITGANIISILIGNIYRRSIAHHLKLNDYYFYKSGYIASKIKAFKLTRPQNQYTFDKQMDLILNALEQEK